MDSENELLEQLYTRYEQKMYQVAFAVLGQEQQAEDAVQDAFVKLTRYMKRIKDVESERTKRLLIRIIRTTAIDQYRRNQRDAERLTSEDALAGGKVISIDEMMQAEDRQMIRRLLQKVPQDYLEIIKLRCYFEVSNKEAAQILEISEDAAAKRLERARKYVQEKMGDEEYEGCKPRKSFERFG
ncbi:RNA polymerase sigma factor [Ruminococcus gauvreauii]|uniref:RNA polymerase sigma factor n=1 Tax=Ruminococcus gauvreauii TaxID=438033 RepID=A0ABY5VEZ0_9FIRM|nr:RNA polymerase sigma factor [Ruminococcus gauvreauii]UWP58023.1 RNA polymerase sigma factor [Ruminococcus gauvreauii]